MYWSTLHHWILQSIFWKDNKNYDYNWCSLEILHITFSGKLERVLASSYQFRQGKGESRYHDIWFHHDTIPLKDDNIELLPSPTGNAIKWKCSGTGYKSSTPDSSSLSKAILQHNNYTINMFKMTITSQIFTTRL